jgi:site-specific recombinase XerC
MVTSLRVFLRFAHATGRSAVPLAGAVPGVASWRLAGLPRGMPAAEIERLLADCERQTTVGLRDYAVLSLLARLGLRGAEAAGLQLADIDWRAGELTVTGKGSRTERLPLPVMAGEALACWLRGRGVGVSGWLRAPLYLTEEHGRYAPHRCIRCGRNDRKPDRAGVQTGAPSVAGTESLGRRCSPAMDR